MNRDAHFLRNLVIGDEAGFGMDDGKVNSLKVPAGHPPQANFDVNMTREQWTMWVGL